MSDSESSAWSVGSGDPRWLCLVTLFVASLVTLLLYLVQYFQQGAVWLQRRPAAEDNAAAAAEAEEEEADALLGWALSLNSWKSRWRAAWCRALSHESRKSGGPVLLTFEEDGLQSSELVVSQVSSFHKAAGHKTACCKVVGEKLQFSLSAASTATSTEPPCRYTVKIAPLELQLDLQMQESDGEVKVSWGVSHLETWDLQLAPSFTQDNAKGSSVAAVKEKLRQLLCSVCPSVQLSCRPAQAAEVKEAHNKVLSPPKPPRAHDWKLLVKNFKVTLHQEDGSAGCMNPLCVLQLDDPPQRFSTSVLRNTVAPCWDQPFIFELNGRSKELTIQLLNDRQPQENSLLGQVSVPFDLVKKQPKGQQTFALMTKDLAVGSLTTEFTYLEPSEVRSWQPPTPAPTKKVEMDRTVMPCGTVVTTITAVKSKPGRPLPPGLSLEPALKATPSKSKLSERRVSEQPSMLGATVSKALSSSDTELLMLNGTDPVAEAAIRQLHQSAKQKLKSPVKKSTIIISGIAKTPLSQDDELALMADYAAAMDASMSEGGSTLDVTTAIATGASSPSEGSDPQEGPSGVGRPPEDWESQTGEELDHSSLSMCVSEASCKKSRGSFLQKSAKLFFRRRHQRKEPGMSQSHNDLVYLEPPAAVDRASRTATLSRMLNRKLLPKNKSKANGSTSCGEPHA
ncbi:C2 domain-containing protein 2 isoform X2 [Lampris incognitus]|uniref:C2 domain-containing protein 2 isoform X2 n=1 Tax=Lampris incognitus TaxID=2546036 RepID=UPI0024B4FFF8|nr:C2 domain-containing protein 2 isoform X2 [Lampris incognitus]